MRNCCNLCQGGLPSISTRCWAGLNRESEETWSRHRGRHKALSSSKGMQSPLPKFRTSELLNWTGDQEDLPPSWGPWSLESPRSDVTWPSSVATPQLKDSESNCNKAWQGLLRRWTCLSDLWPLCTYTAKAGDSTRLNGLEDINDCGFPGSRKFKSITLWLGAYMNMTVSPQ